MWNADKLEKTAKALLPLMSAVNHVETRNALDSYGIDSGRTLLQVFGTYFTTDFMRQFYDGNGTEFRGAWDELLADVEKNRHTFKFARSMEKP